MEAKRGGKGENVWCGQSIMGNNDEKRETKKRIHLRPLLQMLPRVRKILSMQLDTVLDHFWCGILLQGYDRVMRDLHD